MAASRMTMAVSSATIGSFSSRSEGVLVNNASSRGALLGAPLTRSSSIIKVVPLRKSAKNSNLPAVVRAGVLDDSFFNLNLEYMTKNMPTTTPLPPFDTMPPSSTPSYERSSRPSSYDDNSPPRSRPYESGGPPPAAVEEGPKLYVGNLPWTCDSQQLAEIFQDVGNVELVEVIYDRETSRSRGFGFVTMASQDEAIVAREKLDGYSLGGRALTVSFPQANRGGARVPSERPFRDRPFGGGGYDSENKLFIGNLSWGVDDESLRAKFSDYGKVLDAKVIYDRESGRSRGFGFVTYSNADEVNDAIQNLDGADYDGRQIRVNLAGDKPASRTREF